MVLTSSASHSMLTCRPTSPPHPSHSVSHRNKNQDVVSVGMAEIRALAHDVQLTRPRESAYCSLVTVHSTPTSYPVTHCLSNHGSQSPLWCSFSPALLPPGNDSDLGESNWTPGQHSSRSLRPLERKRERVKGGTGACTLTHDSVHQTGNLNRRNPPKCVTNPYSPLLNATTRRKP